MTREEIKLVIKAFYKVNAVIRTQYDAHGAFKYAQTDEYLDMIIKQYNKLRTGGGK